MLNLKRYGKITEEVVELMLKYIQDNSYRKTAEIINDITGLSITGSCVWYIIQKIGQELKEKEKVEEEKTKEELIEKLKLVIRNSDGGTWTKGKNSKKEIYQLDWFHVRQTLNRNIREKEDSKKVA